MDWTAVIFSFIAGLATAVGALPIYFKKNFSTSSLDFGLAISAGIMLVASFVSLIIPGLEVAQTIYSPSMAIILPMISLIMGYFFIIGIHEILPHEHLVKQNDMKHNRKLSRVALIVLAIALHNFPEGLAVGVGFGQGNTDSGIALALAIALQNMPEGLVVAFSLLSEGSSKHKAFLLALLSGLVEPLAAMIGYLTTTISHLSLPLALNFAGGTMLFVICQEIFPELFREGKERRVSLGVVIGIVTMFVLDLSF